MENNSRSCQNCKISFPVESEDFAFYQKMDVPAPTFCPQCRMQRRFMFRNERSLYKRECDLCHKGMISIFAPDKPYTVYCGECWWGDAWDPLSFGQEYDPLRPFFEQFAELQKRVPFMNLVIDRPTMVNSDYTNHAGYLKNCYLLFDGDRAENILYAKTVYNSKDSMDCMLLEDSELCYENVNCRKCFNTYFSEDCSSSNNVYFSKNCSGCSECFGCVNLKNKSYHIFNQPYSKEEYEKKIKEVRLDSYQSLQKAKEEAYAFWKTQPLKYIHGNKNLHSSGDYVYESKNAKGMYQVRGVEDGKYCQFIKLIPARDIYDYTEWGDNAQRVYEAITVGENADLVKFCYACWPNPRELEYCMFCISSAYNFGCIGLKKGQYCILNKQYSEESFRKLRAKIIDDMNARPYRDAKGREFKYGEFFPYDLSLFDYNETTAQDYIPLSKESALDNGFRWRGETQSEHSITIKSESIPDNIEEVQDIILDEILECGDCNKAFRIVKQELELLRNFKLPVPHQCPECRHRGRLSRINPPFLWDRTCSRCAKPIETSYSKEKHEIIYCEGCYNKELV